MDDLSSILKSINKKFGDTIVSTGVNKADRERFSLGSPSADFMTYNSIPEGAWIEVSGQEGSGKAQPLDSQVLTPNGFVKMGDVHVGDFVMGCDGNPHKVTGVFPQGKRPIYKFTFSDGTSTECSDEHLWLVNKITGSKFFVMSTKELISGDGLIAGKVNGGNKYRYRIPLCSPINFSKKSLPVDPYLLGCLLGDGSLSYSGVEFTNTDDDIIANVNSILKRDFNLFLEQKKNRKDSYRINPIGVTNNRSEYKIQWGDDIFYGFPEVSFALKKIGIDVGPDYIGGYFLRKKHNYGKFVLRKYPNLHEMLDSMIVSRVDYRGAGKKTILSEKIAELGINHLSYDKFIPDVYKYSSPEDRLSILQGLIDTDGYVDKNGAASFNTSSITLANDVKFIVQSLGGMSSISLHKNRTYSYLDEGILKKKVCKSSYEVTVRISHDVPICRCKRKLDRWKKVTINNNKVRSIVSIDYVGEKECQCIYVDSDEHLYLTNDFIVTHNTLLCFLMATDFSRKEEKKSEEERRHILYVDCEGTLDPEWCWTSAHYDVNNQEVKTYYVTPLGQSAEQIFDMIREMVATGKIGLVILDSLTAMAPQQVMDESFEKKEMGGISKPLADFVKRCTGLFNKYRTTFIGINGSIANMSGYGQSEVTGGGTYFKRACSLRVRTKKSTLFDDDWNELKSTAENPAGHIIELALLKSKFCRSDRRLSFIHLNYRKGVDILWDTIELAINIGLIDNSTQGTFKLIDLETGEVMTDSEGNEIKIRGKKNLKPYFESHPEEWKKLYDKVYEKISKKDDQTIKSFEELLNIDVKEHFGITQEDEE